MELLMNDEVQKYLNESIEVGETYINGFGQKVRIICTNRKTNDKYVVVGLAAFGNNPERENTVYFTYDGVSISDERKYDLFRKYTPLDDLAVDTPVYVKRNADLVWLPRHFAKAPKDGAGILVYADGKTSHTSNNKVVNTNWYPQYKLQLEENMTTSP